jgi:O-antigen ligase
LLLTVIGTYALGRFGAAATLALVLAGPPSAAVLALGLRQAIPKFRSLGKSLTWWHGLWLVLLVSGFVIRTRAIANVEQNPLDAAAILRVALVGITAFVLMVRLALRRPPWLGSLFRGLVGVMALFAFVCAVSAIWSVNPSWTLYKSLEYLVDVALLAAILASVRSLETYETLLDWTWVLCGLLVASAWLEAPIWPEEAWEGQYVGGPLNIRLSGIFPGQGSNGLGTLGAIVAAISVCRLLPAVQRKFDRAWYILLLAFGVATMVFTQTRSAMGGFVLGVLLALVFTKRTHLAAALGIMSAAVLALTGAGSALLAFLQRGQSEAAIETLSGRLLWWAPAWDAFKQNPLTGLGAFAGGTFTISVTLRMGDVGPLHSDYVEALVGTGIWGPLLILIGLFGTWWVLIRYLRRSSSPSLERQLAVESIAVLSIITVRSAVMNLIVFHPPLQYFVLLGYAEYLRRRYNRGTATAPFTGGR